MRREHIARSDNLRLLADPTLSAAADRMAAALVGEPSFEPGTAMITTEPAPLKIGEAVRYRALAGEVYDAKIVFVRDAAVVDIDVSLPGCHEPLRLTRIKLGRR